MRGRPKENIEIKKKFTRTYYDLVFVVDDLIK